MKGKRHGSRLIFFFSVLLLLILILAGCGGGGGNGPAPTGQVLETKVPSRLLQTNMRVNIYLPYGYDTTQQYPVLYIMHGYTATEKMWMPQSLSINYHADQLIADGKIRPMIIVAPEMDNSWGINSSETPGTVVGNPPVGSFNVGMYEDYMIKELIPYIDSHYSTMTTREGRFIGGISMGGFIALHYAFVYTDLFSKAGGHSPAIYPGNGTDSASQMFVNFIYPNQTLRQERDPFYLAQHKDLSMMQVYLDAGESDYGCHLGGDTLNGILQSHGISSEFHSGPGSHDGAYWARHLDEYLRFYAGI